MKTKFLLLLVPLIAVVAAYSASAVESKSHSFEIFAPYVGTWEGDFTTSSGKTGKVRTVCRWAGQRSYLYLTTDFTPDSLKQPINVEQMIIGIHGKNKKPHVWAFVDVGQADAPVDVQNGKIIIKDLTYHHLGDKTLIRDTTLEITADDKCVITMTNTRVDGKPSPDHPTLTMKRVDP